MANRGLLSARTIGIAALLTASGAVVALVVSKESVHHPSTRAVVSAIEPVVYLAVSPTGGTIQAVNIHAGEKVRKDQVLLHFDTAKLEAQRRELEDAIHAIESAVQTRDSLSRLPTEFQNAIRDSEPDVIIAEAAYVRALASYDASALDGRRAAKVRLDAASADRLQAKLRANKELSTIRAAGGSSANRQSLLQTMRSRMADLETLRNGADVRARFPGMVDLLDVHPGGYIAPGHPAASLTVEGEYFCDVILPPTFPSSGGLAPGSRWTATILHQSVEGRVESISKRRIPLVLRETRAQAEESVVRVRISSAQPLDPGTPALFELP